jgi:hypothetical protein
MVEVGKVGRFIIRVHDFMQFSICLDDVVYDLSGSMAMDLMMLLRSVDYATVEKRRGRLSVTCDGLKTLYIEDEGSRPGYRVLAIARVVGNDGVNYFVAFSDPMADEYVHYHEWVDRNVNSQGYLYDDIAEFIYVNEWDARPEIVDEWIKMFSDPRILKHFPELSFIVKRLEEVKQHVCDCW